MKRLLVLMIAVLFIVVLIPASTVAMTMEQQTFAQITPTGQQLGVANESPPALSSYVSFEKAMTARGAPVLASTQGSFALTTDDGAYFTTNQTTIAMSTANYSIQPGRTAQRTATRVATLRGAVARGCIIVAHADHPAFSRHVAKSIEPTTMKRDAFVTAGTSGHPNITQVAQLAAKNAAPHTLQHIGIATSALPSFA